MPFNGAGMFVRLRNWVEDAAAGVKIRADYHDIEDDNFAGGISQCIARDGQSVVTNNIPMNSKRLVSLQDPTDPQDASTKAYADTKLPLTGGKITGDLEVTGKVTATGYRLRAGVSGVYYDGSSVFNFTYTASGRMEGWVNATSMGEMANTAYVEQRASDWAHAVADPKVNRAGDTMTGYLQVNGELIAAATYIRFNYSGSPGYLLWNGGGTYSLGGGGTIWHTGNLNPIINAQLVYLSDQAIPRNNAYFEPYGGGVITGLRRATDNNGVVGWVDGARFRQLQMYTALGGWFAVSYA